MAIRAVVFDAYGTLFDVQSVLTEAEALCPGKGSLVTQIWRLKQLEYTWLQSLMGPYRDFADVTRASLDFALKAAGVAPSAAITAPLLAKYLALDLYPEAKAALAALTGLKRAILSNGSPGMLEPLVRTAGIDAMMDAVISIEPAKVYKPHPDCYALVERSLSVQPAEVLFVSSNGFDVAGAKSFGFEVAWIRRGGGPPVPDGAVDPALLFRLLRGRAEELSSPADHVVAALTDLLGLLRAEA